MIFFIDRSKIVLRSEHAQVERPNNELGGTGPPQVQIQKVLTKCSRIRTKMYLILRQDYMLRWGTLLSGLLISREATTC